MTALDVRRIRFDFGDKVPFLWNPGDPFFSAQMNATSIIAIGFEKFIVAATKEALPLLTDPAVAEEATGFLGQEAQHAAAHRHHMRALIASHPGLQKTLDAVIASFDELTRTRSLKYRLAYIADLEASFTPNFKLMLDHQDELFRPGLESVASLFLWHFVEEVEHRSSALVVYNAVVPRTTYRLVVLPSVLKHLVGVMGIIARGFNEHVPFEDRQLDALKLDPVHGFKKALRGLRPGAKPKHTGPRRDRWPSELLPKDEKKAAHLGILKSQSPQHDPEHQPLPDFAERWLTSYDAGTDVSQWYAAS